MQHQQRRALASFSKMNQQPANVNKAVLKLNPFHRRERLLKMGIRCWHWEMLNVECRMKEQGYPLHQSPISSGKYSIRRSSRSGSLRKSSGSVAEQTLGGPTGRMDTKPR